MLREELHGQAGTDVSPIVNLIGFTAGFLIATLLLVLTLRAVRLPGTPRANIAFALCGLVWNAGGLIHAFVSVSGIAVGNRVLLVSESAHFSGAVVWSLPILAIWRSFAVLPWQKAAARILRVVAYSSAAATIGLLLWTAALAARYHFFPTLFRVAI